MFKCNLCFLSWSIIQRKNLRNFPYNSTYWHNRRHRRFNCRGAPYAAYVNLWKLFELIWVKMWLNKDLWQLVSKSWAIMLVTIVYTFSFRTPIHVFSSIHQPSAISHNSFQHYPNTNMGPTWVLSATDGAHIDPMNLAIRVWHTWRFTKHEHLNIEI